MKNNWSVRLWVAACALLLSAIGCAPTSDEVQSESVQATALTQLSPEQQEQKRRADEARKTLFETLVAELTRALSEEGPVKSISVCKKRAPEVANEIGEQKGVKIGRTSFKLRNPNNAAPGWAAPFVANRVEDEVAVALPGEGLGVLTPIRLQPMCTMCHGTDEQVLPEIKAAIHFHYPDDQATGFSEGDIRGYFWVEVPAAPNSAAADGTSGEP